jgi:hypothetical protein
VHPQTHKADKKSSKINLNGEEHLSLIASLGRNKRASNAWPDSAAAARLARSVVVKFDHVVSVHFVLSLFDAYAGVVDEESYCCVPSQSKEFYLCDSQDS